MPSSGGTAPPPWRAALRGLCPRCGAPDLFVKHLRFAPRCRTCGLDFLAFNVGDGPAALATLVVGGLVAGLAIALELAASPPWWVHLLIWPPATLVLVFGTLRIGKAAFLALEYRHAAHEGRVRQP